jgi:hypothetical protein
MPTQVARQILAEGLYLVSVQGLNRILDHYLEGELAEATQKELDQVVKQTPAED